MSEQEQKAVRALITGRVQGVFFRAWTQEQATARGLVGWVRNRRDGSVEALFSGPAGHVDDMIGACHQGPTGARVDEVSVAPADEAPPDGFAVKPTA